MDILNWLYLAKNKFVRTTLSSTKDLMIFGANVGFSKRGDKYQNYAMSAEDFLAINRPYKVYTALLTQSGGDTTMSICSDAIEPLSIGVTYFIDANDNGGDFTNVGAPNNNQGTYFVATGTTPNSWGIFPEQGLVCLTYNTGAPVVTVLENTIGNIWFTYFNLGIYQINANNLFTINKTWTYPNNTQSIPSDGGSMINLYFDSSNRITLETSTDGIISYGGNPLRLEIRVYN